MNNTEQPLRLSPRFKRLAAPAVIGLILFLFIQVLPALSPGTEEAGTTSKLLSKTEAAQHAGDFVRKQGLLDPAQIEHEPLVTYQSNSGLYGYLAREDKLKEYNKSFESKYPYDVFRVRFDEGRGKALNVDVHMQNGGIVGFSYDMAGSSYEGAMLQEGVLRRDMLRLIEGELTLQHKEKLAAPWVTFSGIEPSRLKLTTPEGSPGLIYSDASAKVGEAVLQLSFTFENGELRSFEQTFAVPQDHSAYVEKQTLQATLMTLIGYGLFTLILGILAIVYSVKTRAFTSFKRGVFLAVCLFVIQMLNTYNLKPFLEAEGMSLAGMSGMMMFYFFYSLVMSLLLYFSLVGGDGLWRKESGLNPWPRAREAGYGPYVLQSMKLGYLWALILLGVQSIIFVLLGLVLDTWSTTDASQSPYNMLYPWLFPLMAWFAGISEEAVYRLFGIRMVKKIVRSTFAASLITSIIWALGHTLYPIYPVLSRPIELVIIGLLFSFIFLRYGYLTAMFTHVIFNSILMGFSLMLLNDTANLLIGAFYIILPAMVAYVIYKYNARRSFA